MNKGKWCCPECGNAEVEALVWADINTGEIIEFQDYNKMQGYCRNCENTISDMKWQEPPDHPDE